MMLEVSRALGHFLRLIMPCPTRTVSESATNTVPRGGKVTEALINLPFSLIYLKNVLIIGFCESGEEPHNSFRQV